MKVNLGGIQAEAIGLNSDAELRAEIKSRAGKRCCLCNHNTFLMSLDETPGKTTFTLCMNCVHKLKLHKKDVEQLLGHK